jgi:putative phosphoribosyl transferase
MMPFRDRIEAGQRLGRALADCKTFKPVVLALPRGGVPVAIEVARTLEAPLDLVLVRKLSVPMQPELAMGAVAEGPQPVIVRNGDIIRQAGIAKAEFEATCEQQLAEIERRRKRYLGARQRPRLADQVVIVIDDGIATGATMLAALRAVRRQSPHYLILAVPVASPDALELLRREADEIVCLEQPKNLNNVASFYLDYHQISDDEVVEELAKYKYPAQSEVKSPDQASAEIFRQASQLIKPVENGELGSVGS